MKSKYWLYVDSIDNVLLSTYLFIIESKAFFYIYVNLFISYSIYINLSLSTSLYSLFIHQSIYISLFIIYLYFNTFLSMSIYSLSMYLSIYSLSIYLSGNLLHKYMIRQDLILISQKCHCQHLVLKAFPEAELTRNIDSKFMSAWLLFFLIEFLKSFLFRSKYFQPIYSIIFLYFISLRTVFIPSIKTSANLFLEK